MPSTKDQLVKLASNIRLTQRRNIDSNDRSIQSKFKISCSQTGGGQSDKPPDGNIAYSKLYLNQLGV